MILLPLVLHAGNTMDYLFNKFKYKKSILVIGVMLVLISFSFSFYQNFVVYKDFKKNKIGYMETSEDINRLISDINSYSKGTKTNILITADSYWPLPVFLKNYNISYMTSIQILNTSSYPEYDIFISNIKQLENKLASFERKDYDMRQGYKIAVLFGKKH